MFRYGDRARVKEGFYKDCFGILIDCSKDTTNRVIYELELSIKYRNCYRTKTINVTEAEIEIIKEV